MTYDLTPPAMRAARGILKWTMRDLARESSVGLATVNAIENDQRSRAPQAATAERIVDAFARHGVEVLPSPRAGARLIDPSER